MVGRKLHSSGLVPKSLSAQVLDFIAEGGLGLLGLAAAADVVSADCRLNHWVATYLKGTDLSEEKWLELLEGIEKTDNRCLAAMTAFRSDGSIETLCREFSEAAAWLNHRRK